MIHVQIASQVTTTGVHGVRWVMLDSSLAGGGPATAAAAGPRWIAPGDASGHAPGHAPGAGPAAAPPPAPAGRPAGLIKLLVVSLALGAALWLAQARLGPLLQRAGPAGAAPAPAPRAPAPAAQPLRPASAVPAEPLLTAELR